MDLPIAYSSHFIVIFCRIRYNANIKNYFRARDLDENSFVSLSAGTLVERIKKEKLSYSKVQVTFNE